MKDVLVSKVALSASELYAEAYKHMSVAHVKEILPKEWIPTVLGKQYYAHAVSEYHQAMVCKAAKSFGPQVARLQVWCLLHILLPLHKCKIIHLSDLLTQIFVEY